MLEPFKDFILAPLEINSNKANQFNLGLCSSRQNLGEIHQLVLSPTGIEHDFTAQFYLIRGDMEWNPYHTLQLLAEPPPLGSGLWHLFADILKLSPFVS
jgi:hypothetical protein